MLYVGITNALHRDYKCFTSGLEIPPTGAYLKG